MISWEVDDLLSSAKQTINKANDTSIVMRPHQGSARINPIVVAHSLPFLSASQPTIGDAKAILMVVNSYCREIDGKEGNIRKRGTYR